MRLAHGVTAVVDVHPHGDVDDVHHPRGLCLLHVTIKQHGDVNDVHPHGDVDDVHHPRGLCLLHVTIKKHGDVNDVHQHGDVDDVHHPRGLCYGGSIPGLPSRE
jgi:hypothetical protein